MKNNKLHIISFDVPYPPVYGGIIDVFYKIKALHSIGVEVILHTYDNGTGKQAELNKYCVNVFYYNRTLSISNVFSRIPFIVKTRVSNQLVENLNKINAPILFEGIHTTFPLINNTFKTRLLIIRAHNIEHDYYSGLVKSETSKRKKIFYKSESIKLKRYEKIMKKFNLILPISPFEYDYFNLKYNSKTIYLPAFHQNNEVLKLSAKGNYAFYHGDLRISDNIKTVFYLIKIFSKLPHQLIIAGGIINEEIIDEISKFNHIDFVKIKNNEHLIKLLQKAHVNVLPTFQKTGIKLKLINTLYNSRFCLVNDFMIKDTGLESLCEISNSISDFRKKVNLIFSQKYTDEHYQIRTKVLKTFNTIKNAEILKELLN